MTRARSPLDELVDRLDKLTYHLDVAAERLGPPQPDLLEHLAAEARDAAAVARRLGTTKTRARPARTQPPPKTSGNRARWLAKNNPHDGTRRCAGCEQWLPVEDYDTKNSRGLLRAHCRACYSEYQRHRYVAANKTAIIIEVVDGDQLVGAICNTCGKAFNVGDLVAGSQLVHQGCIEPAAKPAAKPLPGHRTVDGPVCRTGGCGAPAGPTGLCAACGDHQAALRARSQRLIQHGNKDKAFV